MEKNNKNLGLVSVSFRQHTPREIAAAAASAGLGFIEWGSDVHAPWNDVQRLREIVALQKQYGLSCSSYGTYFRLGETPIEELRGYIDAAKMLGTKILRLWCGTKCGADMTAAEVADLIVQCRLAAAEAEEEGVILCMECHQKTFTQRLEDALFLMHEVDSPHFKMYWQPFQWQSEAENLVYARAIAPYVHHLHVFQWKGKSKFSLAEGVEEWRRYLDCFAGQHTLLLEFMPDGQISTLPAEADALREIAGDA